MSVNHDPQTSPAEFASLEAKLRDERPSPTGAELDRARARAVNAAATSATRRRRPITRLALVSLVSGAILASGSGASLALSGSAGSGNAGANDVPAQPFVPSSTPSTPTTTPDNPTDLPNTDKGQPTLEPTPDQNGVEPNTNNGDSPGTSPTQAVRQLSAHGNAARLPFTGFAALPVLGLGVVLLAAGFLLRRRTPSPPAA